MGRLIDGDLAPALGRLLGPGVVTPDAAEPGLAATIASSRGRIYVRVDEEQQRFFVMISEPLHPWAHGGTAELSEVAGVVELWRRGALLRDLRERFPFMEYDRMAQAYEDGNDLEVRWELLLDDPEQHRIRPLLLAAQATAGLSRWYPLVTHLTFVRFMERLHDKTAGQVFIALQDGSYEVSAGWDLEPRPAASVAEAVAAAEELLGGRSGA